ncbi:MAG: hypothetical protein RI924_1342 [Bacteroidota bacterium]|jgi:hypothetical protein
MRLKLFFLFIGFCSVLNAQEIPVKVMLKEAEKSIAKKADTTQWTIKSGGLLSVNVTQGTLSNWAAGGDKFSLAINSYFNFFRFYRKGNHTWDNNLDINLGFVKTTSLGSRKNDDRVDFVSKSGHKIRNNLFASGLFNFRSQFFDGYTYGSNRTSTFSSTILSPAYLFLSAGIDYRPEPRMSVFFSAITSRWTVVMNNYLSDKGAYGVEPGKHSINAFGALASINYSKDLAQNVFYKGRIDLFSNYRRKPQNVDLFMTNNFTFKINKYLSANYNLDLIYDDDVQIFGPDNNRPGLQLKSILGIGFLTQLKERKK